MDTMTLRQLADYLQMSVDTIYHLVSQGKIPGVKIGKQWRFCKSAIDRWLASESGGSARVLVVGSIPPTTDVLLKELQARGHQAIEVETIEQVVLLLSQLSFDVVILDLRFEISNDVVRNVAIAKESPELILISGNDRSRLLESLALVSHATVFQELNSSVVDLVEKLLVRNG